MVTRPYRTDRLRPSWRGCIHWKGEGGRGDGDEEGGIGPEVRFVGKGPVRHDQDISPACEDRLEEGAEQDDDRGGGSHTYQAVEEPISAKPSWCGGKEVRDLFSACEKAGIEHPGEVGWGSDQVCGHDEGVRLPEGEDRHEGAFGEGPVPGQAGIGNQGNRNNSHLHCRRCEKELEGFSDGCPWGYWSESSRQGEHQGSEQGSERGNIGRGRHRGAIANEEIGPGPLCQGEEVP